MKKLQVWFLKNQNQENKHSYINKTEMKIQKKKISSIKIPDLKKFIRKILDFI